MINNLIIRNYSIDVFILSKLSNSQNIDITGVELAKELEEKNFPVITKYIMSTIKMNDLQQSYKEILDYFKKKNKTKEMEKFRKMMEVSNVNPGIILLSLIFTHYNKKLKIKMNKNVIVDSFCKSKSLYASIALCVGFIGVQNISISLVDNNEKTSHKFESFLQTSAISTI